MEKEVDFLLLGGDLFHENKPSSKSMTRCVQLLRKYCLGTRDNPIKINIVSDQKVNFNHSAFPVVNYEDENLKISLPVFSIHGNHDDPVGKEPLCALDTLSAMGLVNFFGKYVNVEHIDVQPLLLEKGEEKVALYGLGSIPEERLHRMFKNEQVEFIAPEGNSDRWFKIFIVHQNRVAHGTKYLPESFLGDLPDLVVWGHEHEAITDLHFNPELNFHVYQPGSTVATSLCAAEAAPKHVGLLSVSYNSENDSNNFRLETIPLKTPRRMICEDINIDSLLSSRGDRDDGELNDLIFEFLCEKIQEQINKAAVDHSGHPMEPLEPLIRIRAEYTTEYHHINPGLFNHKFLNKVANPKEIVMFKYKRTRSAFSGNPSGLNVGELDDLLDYTAAPRCNIDDVIYEYFQNTDEKNKLTLLSEKVMVTAIKEIVEKEQTTERLTQAVDFLRTKIHNSIVADNPIFTENKPEIETAIKQAKEKYMKDDEKAMKELKSFFQTTNGNSEVTINDSSDDDLDDNHSSNVIHSPTSSTSTSSRATRGRGRATRGSAAGRGRGRGKNLSNQGSLESMVKITRRS